LLRHSTMLGALSQPDHSCVMVPTEWRASDHSLNPETFVAS
jgi:hypothetical protein